MIGGFIITGATPKKVLVRAIGPSLASFGVAGVLSDPIVRIFAGQTAIAHNNDWQSQDALCQTSGYACGTAADIVATGLAPSNVLESAILITLPPGAYTAIVSGLANSTGVGLVEVFEVDTLSRLSNISTGAECERRQRDDRWLRCRIDAQEGAGSGRRPIACQLRGARRPA